VDRVQLGASPISAANDSAPGGVVHKDGGSSNQELKDVEGVKSMDDSSDGDANGKG